MDNQITTQPEYGNESIKKFLLSPDVKARFEDMMGRGASYYLNQVMIVVYNSSALQKCTPQSLFIAAMRAATLRLSVDPGQGQAWIIPRKGVATFQIGYKGVYELAQRTNLYRHINVPGIYADEDIEENRTTGIHTIVKRTNPLLDGTRFIVDKRGHQVWAYMLYFKLTNGFEKTVVMTVEDIEQHALIYTPASYKDPDSAWNRGNGRDREKMLMKTVLMNGLKSWGRFNPGDKEALIEIEEGQETQGEMTIIPQQEQETTPPPPEVQERETATPEQIKHYWPANARMTYETAAGIKNGAGELYISFAVHELEAIYQNIVTEIRRPGHSAEVRTALEFKRDVAQAIENAIIAYLTNKGYDKGVTP